MKPETKLPNRVQELRLGYKTVEARLAVEMIEYIANEAYRAGLFGYPYNEDSTLEVAKQLADECEHLMTELLKYRIREVSSE